jgi:hypothetical protein
MATMVLPNIMVVEDKAPVTQAKAEGETKLSIPFIQLFLRLDKETLARLKKDRVYCDTRVRQEFQEKNQKYVVRGIDSGGATPDIGHYITYCNVDGSPLNMLHPVETFNSNGLHAVVVAPDFIKVEMLRIGKTYNLMISHSRNAHRTRNRKRWLLHYPIFLGLQGYLGKDLVGKDANVRGQVKPEFYTHAGEVQEIPEQYHSVVRAVTAAVNTINLNNSVYALPPKEEA